jgi:hypothetical protein
MDPINSGCREYEGGESWLNWWVFPLLTEGQVDEVMERLDLGRYYGGPGQMFTRHASVRHGKTRTVITQYGGYDV